MLKKCPNTQLRSLAANQTSFLEISKTDGRENCAEHIWPTWSRITPLGSAVEIAIKRRLPIWNTCCATRVENVERMGGIQRGENRVRVGRWNIVWFSMWFWKMLFHKGVPIKFLIFQFNEQLPLNFENCRETTHLWTLKYDDLFGLISRHPQGSFQ